MHVLKLFAAAVFNKFPRLRLVLGHMEGMLPFNFERILYVKTGLMPERRDGVFDCRGFKASWDENIRITTSGIFGISPMTCWLRTTNVDRIVLSVDWLMS